jgi:hypothetical protein
MGAFDINRGKKDFFDGNHPYKIVLILMSRAMVHKYMVRGRF